MTDETPARLVVVERRVGDVVVLDVIGRMTVEGRTHDLSVHVERCLDAGQRELVLNLGDVTDCDTGGIGALTTSLTTTGVEGGVLFLVAVQPHVRALLDETGLSGVFRVFRGELAAVDAAQRYLDGRTL